MVTELPNLSPTPIRACPLPEPCHPLGLPNSLGSCLSSMHIPSPSLSSHHAQALGISCSGRQVPSGRKPSHGHAFPSR